MSIQIRSRARSVADKLSVASGFGLSAETESAVSSCLASARDRPDLLRLLPRKDVEVVVANAAPALFKDGDASAQRLQQYLAGVEDDVSSYLLLELVALCNVLWRRSRGCKLPRLLSFAELAHLDQTLRRKYDPY